MLEIRRVDNQTSNMKLNNVHMINKDPNFSSF
jgi:hypothetical protein